MCGSSVSRSLTECHVLEVTLVHVDGCCVSISGGHRSTILVSHKPLIVEGPGAGEGAGQAPGWLASWC